MIIKVYLNKEDNIPNAFLFDSSFFNLFFGIEENVVSKISKDKLENFLSACYKVLLNRTLEFSKMILPNKEKDYSINYESSVEQAFCLLSDIYSKMGEYIYVKSCT